VTQLELTVWGKARLSCSRGVSPSVRRKSLALLYYLALEGEATRDRLADLLWGHGLAANNLRVELSGLRQILKRFGLDGFESGLDPLVLPGGVALATQKPPPGSDLRPLEGLDDVSPQFQDWLERKRSDLRNGDRQEASALARELAETIRAPFLLLVRPQLADSARETARELAAALNASYREGPGSGPGVHYLPPPYTTEATEAVLANDTGIFVIEKSGHGDVSAAVLQLRAQYPVERTRFLRLPALSWFEARKRHLSGLPFDQAAAKYLAADGNPVYLQELAGLRQQQPDLEQLPPPRRITAQVRFSTSALNPPALLALERCSVHPGALPDGLVHALGAQHDTEELERTGWLVFDAGSGTWALKSWLIRRILYGSLQPGRRRQYHLLAARYFTETGQDLPALHHGSVAAGGPAGLQAGLPRLSGWARSALSAWAGSQPLNPLPPSRDLTAGSELILLPDESNDGVEHQGDTLVIKRQPLRAAPCQLGWELPGEAFLLRLRGRGYAANVLEVGLSGCAAPLELGWTRFPARVILARADQASRTEASELLLPLDDEFEYWVRVPGGGRMLICSRAEAALIEFEVTAFRLEGQAAQADGGALRTVSAFLLDELGYLPKVPVNGHARPHHS
jgi:hypothetical protein